MPELTLEAARRVFNKDVLNEEIKELLPLIKEYILASNYKGMESWEKFI